MKLEETVAEDFLELKKEMHFQTESILNFESYRNVKESIPRLMKVKTKVVFISFVTHNFPFLFPYLILLNLGHESVGCNISSGFFFLIQEGYRL